MLTAADIQIVRDLMGGYGASIPDDVLMNATILALTESEVLAIYPDAATETDPDRLAQIKMAQAYLVASYAIANTSGKVTTRLGDMTITEDVPTVDLADQWRTAAWAILRRLYPGARRTFFTLAHGQRGGGNRRATEGADRRW